ncbi:hypothetical protein TRFO_21122 [Tritrichomonas foetus]|uniref:Uncharacterized protein n=1 Tax=Tritrichomonas foetus TaxID=1144522 RepID=A0A1J4KFW9_9EUKA|nr:hypothetical protein TRFO_21122 [Tritrichomonas foetus]|eukprot:OHT09840.1 hypothetical protein TRFO_21122 [Tritrichomonas foetus]
MNEMQDLEEQLENAIEQCDFTLASQIKEKILELQQNSQDNTIQMYIDSFSELAKNCKDDLEEEINNLDESISNQEMLIRRKVSNIFHELQVKHVEALIEVEKDNLLKYAKEKLRPVPEATELREQAKLAGFNKKFEQATKLKEKAEKVENKEMSKREEIIKNEYFSRRKLVLTKQKEEIKNLTNQLNDSIYNLSKRKEFELEKIYQRYRKGLGDAYENTRTFIATIPEAKLRQVCIKECSYIYKETVKEAFPQDAFKSPPQSGKSTPQTNKAQFASGKSTPQGKNPQTPSGRSTPSKGNKKQWQ